MVKLRIISCPTFSTQLTDAPKSSKAGPMGICRVFFSLAKETPDPQ